ncbi:putative uracil/xanthine transporter [compost metagenome]
MTIDVKLLAQLPAFVQPLVSNGFIVGVMLSIIMEATIRWDKPGRQSAGNEEQ